MSHNSSFLASFKMVLATHSASRLSSDPAISAHCTAMPTSILGKKSVMDERSECLSFSDQDESVSHVAVNLHTNDWVLTCLDRRPLP